MSQTTANNVDLSKYDFELLIDKSGSMSTEDCPGNKSRWDWAKEQTLNVARTMHKYDSDGIVVTFFAGNYKTYENVTPDKVEQLFKENSPNGSTDTAAALESRLGAYRNRANAGTAKPVILAVITDGEPTDRQAVRNTIINHTKWMNDDNQTGISFMQVGKDNAAQAFLTELDDKLEGEGAKFDIVDCKSFDQLENMSVEEALIESLTD